MEAPPPSSSSHSHIITYTQTPAPPPPHTPSGSGSGSAPLSRYESQKRRDWNTFGQFLKNQRPPVALAQCTCHQVLDFLRYLDQFGKTKVHQPGCMFYGQPDPPAPCTCPLRQAWGSLDALIGRLRAAYEEHGGSPQTNPFAASAIRVYLREVRECQAKARGIPYKKKKKKKPTFPRGGGGGGGGGSSSGVSGGGSGGFGHDDHAPSPGSSSSPTTMISSRSSASFRDD
ncbi:hypothetical protein Cgig2_013859 [Carnegiea gigantea]|uniref:ALOG domain-containing protein n=1 Tax=Carnegiea gigantea TaxID=171969 RepID=A0A9Q1KKE8_9CARY|nr:hypothetical protein Cgig2_013859 [Carnegiea gigantea]